MTNLERDEAVAESLGSLARVAVESVVVNEAASRARLLLRAERSATGFGWRASGLRKAWFALPVCAAASCALLVWWRTPSALSYEVIGAAKGEPYVSAPADHSLTVQFSDRTLVRVEPSSQLRVEETTPNGARVLLERGQANVHVVHRPSTHWTFAAGPFEVLVTGTKFDLKWDPTQEKLNLDLREGSVRIKTPLGAAPVELRAGQDFQADLRHRTMTTTDVATLATDTAANAAPSASVAELPDQAASAPLATVSASANSAAPPSAAKSWAKLVAAGEFKELLRQANERGVGNCARACSESDLSALADAARYTGHGDVAEQSLRSLRARFSEEPEGRAAAFLLGRLREGQGAAVDAKTWYETYLNESPSGAYAAEALAGKMRAVSTLQGNAAAKPIAEEYLRRYPNGVQATTARSLLGSP